MSPHAPGPWMIGTNTDRGQILDAEGERVCRVTNDPTAMANAHLIAAAPDLLSGLQDFVRMFIDTKRYPDPETITTWLRIFLPEAVKAIERAEGRP